MWRWRKSAAPRCCRCRGWRSPTFEVETAEEEVEEDVLEDTSDLEGGDEAVVDVEIESEAGEEER